MIIFWPAHEEQKIQTVQHERSHQSTFYGKPRVQRSLVWPAKACMSYKVSRKIQLVQKRPAKDLISPWMQWRGILHASSGLTCLLYFWVCCLVGFCIPVNSAISANDLALIFFVCLFVFYHHSLCITLLLGSNAEFM